jgi:membrane-bound lytic murein transglycosylase B
MWRSIVVGILTSVALASVAPADDRGWGYLIDKLIAGGVSRERVLQTFQDARVAPFTGIDFSPSRPRERRALYRRFLRPRSLAAARSCRARYADAFERAERTHHVPASLLAAVLFVETACGRNTGSHLIFTRLARLAMANAPDNLRRNLARFADANGALDPEIEAPLHDRARYLEHTFYPEVRALFAVSDRMGVSPLAIRGSGAGAFGYPQFLPTNYLEDGTDGNGDGRVSLYDPADAAASCARYFVRHGWRPDLPLAQRRAVVWQYNRSDAYVDTVLTLAARIQGGVAAPHRTMVAGRRKTARHASARRTVRHTVPRRRARGRTVRS